MNLTPRIVVVEDDPIIAADLVERIRDLGYARPESFDFAEDALAALIADPPALALVDIQLAGEMDGVEAVRRFREARSATGTAAIFLTSNTERDRSFTRDKDRLVPVFTASIAYVRADGYCCYAKTGEREGRMEALQDV